MHSQGCFFRPAEILAPARGVDILEKNLWTCFRTRAIDAGMDENERQERLADLRRRRDEVVDVLVEAVIA